MLTFRALWSAHLRLIATRQLDVMIFVLYFGVLAPTALVARMFRHHALQPEFTNPTWKRRESPPTSALTRMS